MKLSFFANRIILLFLAFFSCCGPTVYNMDETNGKIHKEKSIGNSILSFREVHFSCLRFLLNYAEDNDDMRINHCQYLPELFLSLTADAAFAYNPDPDKQNYNYTGEQWSLMPQKLANTTVDELVRYVPKRLATNSTLKYCYPFTVDLLDTLSFFLVYFNYFYVYWFKSDLEFYSARSSRFWQIIFHRLFGMVNMLFFFAVLFCAAFR